MPSLMPELTLHRLLLEPHENQFAAGYIAEVLRHRGKGDEFFALVASLLDGNHPTHRLELTGKNSGKRKRPDYNRMSAEIYMRIAENGQPSKRAYGEVAEKFGYSLTAVRKAYREVKAAQEHFARIEEEWRNTKPGE